MRETKFIKQNKEKWIEFEEMLSKQNKDPEKLSKLFVQITDDLSYSRTFYPNRSVRVYLNSLAQQIFYKLYRTKKARSNQFIKFWTDELPQLVWESRREFLLSLGVFALAFGIGMLSCAMEPDFPRTILGDDYVDMTLENIRSGDPMAVYKQRGELDMSLGITFNNLMVAFRTFVLGVFFAVGTLGIMIYNGIMVGAFQFFFYEQGVFLESFLTIWIHGTLEISAIIIAGAAGLTMGRGLVFPGTYSRLQAFQISARRGMKIMLGIAPIIIAAGFIEGFLTRYTEVPDILRALFILTSLGFILFYFAYYPWQKAKKGFAEPLVDAKLPPSDRLKIKFGKIKTTGEVFNDVFSYISQHLKSVLASVLVGASIYAIGVLLVHGGELKDHFSFTYWSFTDLNLDFHFENLGQYFNYEKNVLAFILNTIIYSLVFFLCGRGLKNLYQSFDEEATENKNGKFIFDFINCLIITSLWMAIFFIDFFAGFVFFGLTPFFALWAFVAVKENKNIGSALGRTVGLILGNIGLLVPFYIVLFCMGLMFSFLIDSAFMWFFYEIVNWNFLMEPNNTPNLLVVLMTFSTICFFLFMAIVLSLGMGILYDTLVEIKDAKRLKAEIPKIGERKKFFGMEREL